MNNNILVLNYGLGNPSSISNMLQYSNIQHVVDNDPNLIKKFKQLLFLELVILIIQLNI